MSREGVAETEERFAKTTASEELAQEMSFVLHYRFYWWIYWTDSCYDVCALRTGSCS